MAPRLSIVMPVRNEAQAIVATLSGLSALRRRGVELIVVDGGSSDNTAVLARPWVDQLISAAPGRASQMNAGAAQARGQVLLFLHADTQLPPVADALIQDAVAAGAAWGRFDVRISGRHWMLRVVARLMNLRSAWTGVATGDQGIFVKRALFERCGGYAQLPLMEDIELSKRLLAQRRHIGRPARLRPAVLTSGRRWESRGVWRTIVLMWRLRWRYWRGEAPALLARDYT